MSEILSNTFSLFITAKYDDISKIPGAFFYDKDKKIIVYVYNDIIHDEFKNEYVGYRDINDVAQNNETNSIIIVPVARLEKRITSNRLLPLAPDLDDLRSTLSTVYRFNTLRGILAVFNNYETVSRHCSEKLFTGIYKK